VTVEQRMRARTGLVSGRRQRDGRETCNMNMINLNRLAASTVATLFATMICVSAAIGPGVIA
jgi:hypothetical protein